MQARQQHAYGTALTPVGTHTKDITLDQLRAMRVFCRVADVGAFARAAESLDLAPAVVTRLIAELEEHLGARLINRTTRRLALTDVGGQYLERARSILSQIDDAEAVASLSAVELRGRLSVLAPASFAVHQLAKHIGVFRERHPQVTIELTISSTVQAPDENHDVTIIVQRARPIDGLFIARRIASTDVVLCASTAYLDRHGRPATTEQLADHDLLMPIAAAEGRDVVLYSTLDGERSAKVSITKAPPLITTHIDTLHAAALSDLGIAAIPSMIADTSLATRKLEHVLPEWHLGNLTLFASMPTRKHMPLRTSAFVDFLLETFRSETRDPWLAVHRS